MQAVFAWLDEAEALARRHEGLVVMMQANPFVKPRFGGDNGYAGILERLRAAGPRHARQGFAGQGDTHTFKDDEPLPGLRRVEVFGWPQIRWVKARIGPDGTPRFQVEAMPP